MNDSASFGRWLKLRRLALDLTQSDLGQVVGCSAMTIRKIEADERRPSRQLAGVVEPLVTEAEAGNDRSVQRVSRLNDLVRHRVGPGEDPGPTGVQVGEECESPLVVERRGDEALMGIVSRRNFLS